MTELPVAHAAERDACIAKAREDLRPATADQIDEAVFVLSGMPSQNVDGAALDAVELMYRIGFDDVPLDLLNEGIRQAVKHAKRFRPIPGEVRAYIQEELDARQRRLARLTR